MSGEMTPELIDIAEKCRDIQDKGKVVIRLNGKSARIYGFGVKFARVSQNRSGLMAEWCWETTYRILTRDKDPGHFKS